MPSPKPLAGRRRPSVCAAVRSPCFNIRAPPDPTATGPQPVGPTSQRSRLATPLQSQHDSSSPPLPSHHRPTTTCTSPPPVLLSEFSAGLDSWPQHSPEEPPLPRGLSLPVPGSPELPSGCKISSVIRSLYRFSLSDLSSISERLVRASLTPWAAAAGSGAGAGLGPSCFSPPGSRLQRSAACCVRCPMAAS